MPVQRQRLGHSERLERLRVHLRNPTTETKEGLCEGSNEAANVFKVRSKREQSIVTVDTKLVKDDE